jgi:sugar phosphate isomerase/epimerase
MRPGVMSSVIGGGDDRAAFERASRSGFAGVEVELRRDDLRAPERERLARLAQARDRSSLHVPSLVLGEHNAGGLASADTDVAEAAAEDVRRAIVWAEELGADIILVPFFLDGELVHEADVDRAARALRALCPLAAQRNVSLCYEGTLPSDRFRDLAARVESAAFGVYFDLANPVTRGMDTATELRALGDLVRRVHLKDTRVRGADVHPGLGRVDFAQSRDALAEIGYDGWLVFETPAAPEEVVRRDLSFARWAFPSLEVDISWPRCGAFSYEFAAGEWERLASTFAGLGLAAVQLGGALLEECLLDPERIAPGMAALSARGVSVVSLAGYRNLVAPDASTRRANIDRIARCLELAPRLGTAVVATETGTRSRVSDWADTHDNWRAASLDLLVDALEQLLPVAERAGSILALEGHIANVLRTPGQLLGLLERFPTPHLQVVCDPYNLVSRHLLPVEERITADFLNRFESRFVIAHLKDVALVDGGVSTPEFGTGDFAQRPYLEFLRDRRPDLPLILEHLPLDQVPAALARVERVLSPVG